MAKRLEKLGVNGKHAWYLVTERRGTTKYRELPSPDREYHTFVDGDGTAFIREEVLDWQQITEIGNQVNINPNEIKKEELAQWARIVAQHVCPQQTKTVVPTTAIRRLYEFMRDDFDDRGFRNGLLSTFASSPQSLIKLCSESFAHFCNYDNREEGWSIAGRNPLPPAPKSLAFAGDTNDVVALLKRDADLLLSNLGFTYITREFHPRRTTNGIFEDGFSARSSGGGGIDIFFKSGENPVVGEIKVKNDADPLYALVQCLTYAVELGTPRQMERLQKHGVEDNSAFLNLDVATAKIELCIICIEHSHQDMYPTLSKITKELEGSPLLPFIGKFHLVYNESDALRRFL